MLASILQRLESLAERHEEITMLLSSPEVLNDSQRFRDLSKEYSQLSSVVTCFKEYSGVQKSIEEAEVLLQESDAEMRALAEEDLLQGKQKLSTLESQLQILLLPQDPDDNRNVFLEIRAGAGGDEAAIFVGDLLRMYTRYAESQRWKVEIMSTSASDLGGYKEVITRIIGQDVYSKLKFESGVHRVQRVPATEAQGRVHTSTCTVAIMPEVDEVEDITINPADLRIDTYRASGAGGQHVNKTDSAIRITHIPTGVVVEMQEERSQHQNRAKAMALLKARLLTAEKDKQIAEQTKTRRALVGTGDRSERIRTYNFPQGRLTDHRINLTLYKLTDIMEGDLNPVIEPLIHEHQADQLAALSEGS